MFLRLVVLSLVASLLAPIANLSAAETPQLKLTKGDHVVLVGNTLAERMQYFGHFETFLHARFPELELVVRNLGWSADEVALRPRSQAFQDHGHTLADHKADVILAFFGFNESFAGEKGLPKFEADLDKFVSETLAAKYNGKSPPQLALIGPIAHENIKRRGYPDGTANNKNIAQYSAAMKKIAAKNNVVFVDLYKFTYTWFYESFIEPMEPMPALTINGIHLNERGDQVVGFLVLAALFGEGDAPPRTKSPAFESLRAAVNEKNQQFFYDHRAVNGFYIYGGRKNPFGVVNFPVEFAKLRKMIEVRDRRIWDIAQGKQVPDKIDDSATGENARIETNYKTIVSINPPEEAQQKFTLPEGYAINLFASEREFPDLQKPVAFAFDAKGRLWVCTMPSYPQYLPGSPPNDKVLILEDTNGDGRADKQTVFADKLYLPAGMEFWGGGIIVAQQPNVMFLKDTNGDDKADVRELILHGFDSADSHHAISAFTLDPGGSLYFEEGTFHYSQIETPWGPERCANAGVFRYEPRTGKLDTFVSYGFANPWGHIFDTWGQNFVADASPGANYFGTAFSGDVDYPHKHGALKQFLTKQWRPTCGCDFVTSRNFPPEAQGNYLLNNCIGFQGVLQYKMKDEGSGFAADPVDPLLSSSDPSFRPVDIEFAPDGSLYVADWYNPLIGHMQHSIRDPNRDHQHGRIWRIHYTKLPLVKPAQIAGQPIAALLDLLKTEPEARTHDRVRSELWNRPTDDVVGETGKWLAGLTKNDPLYEHHKLEALWLHQAHDAINEPLLKDVLRSPDYRARAAATRVLGYWRDRVEKPLDLLRTQVTDEHPRVRLEAVRALSFFNSQAAIDVAVESLVLEQDDYLKYTFNETMKTLERRVKGATSLPHEGTEWDKRNSEGYKVPPGGKGAKGKAKAAEAEKKSK